jgi:hypothetical protein
VISRNFFAELKRRSDPRFEKIVDSLAPKDAAATTK